MSRKKALFFDIDGTLWNRRNEILESTARAIHMLRRNGHLTFLCSGRSRAYIRDPRLFALGFDGVVSGCGTMVEYEGEPVFYHRLDNGLVERTVRTVRNFGMRPILEGKDHLYMDDEEFEGDLFGRKLKAELGEHLLTISGEWGKWEVSKLSCATEGADRESCFRALEDSYDFIIHDSSVAEFVPKGFHKGTGVRKVCELLDMDLSDTFAFGDSINDIEMLRTAGTGIAMGNGSERAKAVADHVTTPMSEDGIWNACVHFGLI